MPDAEDRPGQAAKRQHCCLAATIAKTAQQGTRISVATSCQLRITDVLFGVSTDSKQQLL